MAVGGPARRPRLHHAGAASRRNLARHRVRLPVGDRTPFPEQKSRSAGRRSHLGVAQNRGARAALSMDRPAAEDHAECRHCYSTRTREPCMRSSDAQMMPHDCNRCAALQPAFETIEEECAVHRRVVANVDIDGLAKARWLQAAARGRHGTQAWAQQPSRSMQAIPTKRRIREKRGRLENSGRIPCAAIHRVERKRKRWHAPMFGLLELLQEAPSSGKASPRGPCQRPSPWSTARQRARMCRGRSTSCSRPR